MSEPKHAIEKLLENVEERLGRLFGQGEASPAAPREREPVEYRMQALREIADQVQPTGRGSYYFPHVAVKVTLHRGALRAAFANPHFEQDVQAEIRERGCKVSAIPILVEFGEESEVGYSIHYVAPDVVEESAAPSARPVAHLQVMSGKASEAVIDITKDRVYLGRLAEVKDREGAITRRNDLAFDDTEATVSRRHAWIQYDAENGKFRLFNDAETSATTRIFRDGAPIPGDSVRGVQLRSGDEIHLGNASVRFTYAQV